MRDEMIPDERIDAALRRAPQVSVPAHFANRVAAQAAVTESHSAELWWFRPALWLAGSSVIASLVWTGVVLGAGRWLEQPAVYTSVLAVEAVGTLAWVWRSLRPVR